MTLDEYLKDADPNSFVYIGGKDGEAFFYIGTVAGIKRNLNAENRKILAKITNRILQETADMQECERCIQMGTKAPMRKSHKAETARERRMDDLKKLFMWKHLGVREILERYPHTDEVPGETLLIEGKILGQYWSLSEVHKKKKEAKNEAD